MCMYSEEWCEFCNDRQLCKPKPDLSFLDYG
jgi:hypothetical protein